MQVYDITLPVNTPRLLQAPGRFFRYYAGSAGGGDETILVKDHTGSQGFILQPGQSVTLPQRNDEWLVSNYANAATITGKVVVGDGRLDDDRITGQVSVINGERISALAGNCYIGFAGAAASAGNYSHGQLFNPAAAQRNCFVTKVTIMLLSGPASVGLMAYDTALATAIGAGSNKKRSGGGSPQELRSVQNATVLGTMIGNYGIPAGFDAREYPLAEPILLTPGTGLVVVPSSVNVGCYATFQWTSEGI